MVSITRDESGSADALTPPGRPAHSFGYSPVDLVSSYTPPTASGTGLLSTTVDYNLDRQPATVTLPDGELIQFNYDIAGRLDHLTTDRGTFSVTYVDHRVDTVSTPEGQTLDYDYDGPLLTQTTWSGLVNGSVGFDYDADFKVSEVTVAGVAIPYGHDLDGLLVSAGDLSLTRDPGHGLITATELGSVSTAHTLNTYGEPASFTGTYPGDTYSYDLTWDFVGRITEKTETVQGVTSTAVYTYDAAGRLDTVTVDALLTEDYDYDANGNRTSATVDGVGVAGTYDDQDRMLSYGGQSYTYGARGHQASASGGQTTDYDATGNLLSVTTAGGTTINYEVDATNRRIERTNGATSTRYLWRDHLRIEAELDGADSVVSRFVYGESPNVPEYMLRGGNTYRLLTDHLGSVRLVVNADTGTVAQRIDYDSFGVVQTDTNPGFQPFGFAGGLYDPASGLVRFGARDYDAATGRWTAKDPIGFGGGDSNLYGYVGGNPVNATDPRGLLSERAKSLVRKSLEKANFDPGKAHTDIFSERYGPGGREDPGPNAWDTDYIQAEHYLTSAWQASTGMAEPVSNSVYTIVDILRALSPLLAPRCIYLGVCDPNRLPSWDEIWAGYEGLVCPYGKLGW